MKSPPAWMELSMLATLLMAGMLLLMWTQRSDGSCMLSVEEPRRLVLSRDTDREHLAADLATADRIARRYARSAQDPAQGQVQLLDCHARLVEQLATRHGISREDVRASRLEVN